MKKYSKSTLVILLTTILFCSNIHSQSTLFGLVHENESSPIPFANVLLLNASDSTLIKGAVSDAEGSYQLINIPVGTYLIAATSVGYKINYLAPFEVDQSVSELNKGTIILQEDAIDLSAVVIKGKRPIYEQKIDRLIVNVANTITAAGGTALEVLARSPGVTVNKQWGTLSLNGKSDVLVMVNGKISRMPANAVVQMLDGMSADNIEKIELIHTPPANYDAEGSGGIIHIVLKENNNLGLNGSYAINAGYGKKEKLGANFNFNYRKDKINLYGDYAYSFNNNPQDFNFYRSFEHNGETIETSTQNLRDQTFTHNNQARLGVDYQIAKKTVIGFLAGWSDRNWILDKAIINTENKIDNTIHEIIKIQYDEVNQWRHFLGNINLQQNFNKGQVFNIDLDYAFYNFSNPSNYEYEFYTPETILLHEKESRISKETLMGIFAGKADYAQNLTDKIFWETGFKISATRFDNDVLVENKTNTDWASDPLFSAEYSMVEDIVSAYSSFNVKFNTSSNLKIGLRYEYTQSNLGSVEQPNIVDRKYGNLFPSFFYTKNLNDNNQFQGAYSRRISRPDFTQLAPFFVFFGPRTILTGNPELQPSVSDIGSLSYRWKTIQLMLQYSRAKGAIAPYQPTIDVENNLQLLGAKNIDLQETASVTLSFPVQITNWWEWRNNISGHLVKIKHNDPQSFISENIKTWDYNSNMNFVLPKDFSLEISGYYNSRTLWGGLNIRSMGQLNIGIQKELSNNNGVLKFNVSDVLFTNNFDVYQNFKENDYRYSGYYEMSERVFRLSYSRSFGNSKLKKARVRATGTEEERSRVN